MGFPQIAMARVRMVRPGAIETQAQEAWVAKGEGRAPSTLPEEPKPRRRTRKSAPARMPGSNDEAAQTPGRNRALGALLGLAVGDALGTTIEFSPRDTYPPVVDMVGGGPFGLKPGEWTDDTSMALCLADSLIANKGGLDPIDLAHRFVRWYEQGENSVTGTCFDIGVTTRAALQEFGRTGNPVGDRSPSAAGNGGIMRLAPAVIVAGTDPDSAAKLARAQSEVTHAAEECLASAEVLGRILAAGIAGMGLDALEAAAGSKIASPKVCAIANGEWRGKDRPAIRSSGYVVDTLEAACWAVGTSKSFSEAVLKAVNLGDDADTVGAVTGQIAGAIWGLSAIPPHWIERLSWRDRLIEIGEALWGLAMAS